MQQPPMSSENLYIRSARLTDVGALSRICLLTANAGVSARPLHTLGELPGLVYALPYVHVPYTAGFVLVNRTASADGGGEQAEEVVGYILLATDTRAFEEAAENQWYPPLRTVYPLSLIKDDKSATDGEADIETHALSKPLMNLDKWYIGLLHHPQPALPECIAFGPAHLHIDILPPFQRRGWGRRLIGRAVQYLRDAGIPTVWLAMDPKNKEAAKFYDRIGFEHIEGAPEPCVGLKLENWKD